MKVLKFILVLLLGFFLGILSTLAGIVGGGYYVVTNVTPEDAEVIAQNFVPDFALPEQFPEALLSMTFMEIFSELADIAGNLDSITLNELQERLGYELPLELEDGTDISFLLQPVMDIPISSIPENMDLIMNNVTMDSIISLGLIGEEDLPDLPLFSSAEARNSPLMSLFSGMGSIRISDVITLYTGDYYPNENGNFVLSAGGYAPYDPLDPAHEGLTRYAEIYVFDSEGEFVLIEDNYVAYNESEHAGQQRYSSEIVPSFTGELIISGAVYISYDPGTHSGQQRYILPEASPRALLAIGDAYVNAVPDDDPTGSQLLKTRYPAGKRHS